jgi:hypothetical protein
LIFWPLSQILSFSRFSGSSRPSMPACAGTADRAKSFAVTVKPLNCKTVKPFFQRR